MSVAFFNGRFYNSLLMSVKPIVAIDVDDVLASFIDSICNFYNESFEGKISPNLFFSYEFHHVWGGTSDECSLKVMKLAQ
jgi:hypothetical protein